VQELARTDAGPAAGLGAPEVGCRRRIPSGTLATLAVGALLACLSVTGCRALARGEPSPSSARARRPDVAPLARLPEGYAEELRPRGRATGLELVLLARARTHERYRVRANVYDERRGTWDLVVGEYYRARGHGAAEPLPLIVVAPILAGPVDDYLASRFLCRGACARGFSAFFLHQERLIFDPSRDALDLEAWLRSNVRQNGAVLERLVELPEIDGERVGSFGVSLGAIKNVAWIAAQPRLRASVLALGGAGMADMVISSRERLVDRYARGRLERDGVGRGEVRDEVGRWLVSEPEVLARGIDSGDVLLILARYDDKVPFAGGLRLRAALGDPLTRVVPLGHYTSIALAPWMLARGLDFLEERLDPDREGVRGAT